MFGEAGSETGSTLVSVEFAKKYNKCLIRIVNLLYIFRDLFKEYSFPLFFPPRSKRFRASSARAVHAQGIRIVHSYVLFS